MDNDCSQDEDAMKEPELQRVFKVTVSQLSFVYFIRSCQTLTTKVTFSEEITSIDVNDKNMALLQTNKLWLHSIIIKGYKETSQIDFDNCSA